MEVKPGYKQTEVGVIPEDWEVKTLKALNLDISDGNYSSKYPKASEFRVFGVPFIRANNVRNMSVVDDDLRYISESLHAELQKGHLKKNDILVTTRGEIGQIAFVPDRHIDSNINAQLVRINPSSSQFDHRFVGYLLAFGNAQKQFENLQTGSALKQLPVGRLTSLSIPLPPTKAEQEAIAEALSDADALIESLEQLLVKKRQLKQGAMQELLTGKKRLPGFSGEWEEQALFDLAGGSKEFFNDGDWIESEHITNEGIRLIQTGNIGVGCFIERGDKKYIFEKSFVSLRCKEIRRGDLLICRLADPAGRSCVLPEIGETKIITSVDVTIFRPPAAVANRVFLANTFSTDQWFRAVSNRSGGTTHKRISRGALGRLRIRVPSVEEQSAIATILSDMDAEIAALEAKLAKARQIKQGMMQELLTGRIRLI